MLGAKCDCGDSYVCRAIFYVIKPANSLIYIDDYYATIRRQTKTHYRHLDLQKAHIAIDSAVNLDQSRIPTVKSCIAKHRNG